MNGVVRRRAMHQRVECGEDAVPRRPRRGGQPRRDRLGRNRATLASTPSACTSSTTSAEVIDRGIIVDVDAKMQRLRFAMLVIPDGRADHVRMRTGTAMRHATRLHRVSPLPDGKQEAPCCTPRSCSARGVGGPRGEWVALLRTRRAHRVMLAPASRSVRGPSTRGSPHGPARVRAC